MKGGVTIAMGRASAGLALAAILTGCLGLSGGGCPEPASGPLYPAEPQRGYDVIDVLDVPYEGSDYWSSVTEDLRATVAGELRRSGRFTEVREGAPTPAQPALLLTVEIIAANSLGTQLFGTATPYVAGRFEIQDHAGVLLSSVVKISCGTAGYSSPPENRLRDLSEEVAEFVVGYMDGERPSQ